MSRFIDIPRPLPERQLVNRLSTLVGYRATSLTDENQTPEGRAAFSSMYDKVFQFATEDAKGKPIAYRTGEIAGRPWMMLSNQPIPQDVGTPGVHPYHTDLAIFVHADTVAADSEEQYTLQVDGPYLRGRGVIDMRSAFIPAVSALVNAPPPCPYGCCWIS